MIPDSGFFQINDIVLNIPPQHIMVDRKAILNMWETLRTRSSMKTRSGFAYLTIQVSAIFTDSPPESGGANGIEQLRHLVAQFRVTPFCWVENQYLRDTVLGGRKKQDMALALTNIEISKSTESDNVNSVMVTMKFHWFNYLPFMREFKFRKEPFSVIPVTDPRGSMAWRMLYLAEENRSESGEKKYRLVHSLQDAASKIQLATRQFALFPKEEYKQKQLEIKVLNQMKELIADRGLNDAGKVCDPERVLDTTNGVPADFLILAKEALGDAEGQAFIEGMLGHTTTAGQETNVTNGQGSFSLDALIQLTSEEINLREKFIAEYKWGDDPSSGWTPVILNDTGPIGGASTLEYSSYLADSLIDVANTWNNKEKDKGSVLMQRQEMLDPANVGLHVQGISIGFENTLAMMPVIGHPYPTFQHTGSIDAVVTISLRSANQTAVTFISDFYTLYEDQARKFKQIPIGQKNVHVKNDLINMCGLHEFVINDLVIENVPGYPGTNDVTIRLIENPLTSKTQEAFVQSMGFSSDFEIRKLVIDTLNSFLALNEGEKTRHITVSSGRIGVYTYDAGDMTRKWYPEGSWERELDHPGTSATLYTQKTLNQQQYAYFRYLVHQYNVLLTHAMENLIDTLDPDLNAVQNKGAILKERFPAFFLLTDKEVLGVERMQKDLTPYLARTETLSILYQDVTIPKPPTYAEGQFVPAANTKTGVMNYVSKEAWTIDDVKQDRSILEAWQLIQSQEPSSGATCSEEEELRKNAMSGMSKQRMDRRKMLETFVENTLRQYHAAVITLVDSITRDETILSLPEFKAAKAKVIERSSSLINTGTAYPDFPLGEVMGQIQHNKDLFGRISGQIERSAFIRGLGVKNLSLDALINPDFYIYNSYETGASDPISQTVMKQAQQAISAGQYGSSFDSKQKQEEAYFTEAYSQLLGSKRYDQINASRSIGFQPPPGGDPKNEASRLGDLSVRVEQLKKIGTPEANARAKLLEQISSSKTAESKYLAPNLLTGKVGPSIQERTQDPSTKTTLNELKAITDGENQTAYMSSNIRDKSKLLPNDFSGKIFHTFGDEGLKIQGEGGYNPKVAATTSDEEEPDWGPPLNGEFNSSHNFLDVRTGISTTQHLGVDLTAKRGGNDATGKMEVIACAPGKLVSVSRGINQKSFTYSQQDPNVTHPKLRDKLVEDAVTVIVQHGKNWRTSYTHMQWDLFMQNLSSKFHDGFDLIENRELDGFESVALREINQGDPLGTVGSTGRSTGPHLHFEIQHLEGGKWKAVNPDLKISDGEPIPVKSLGPMTWINPDSESLLTKSVEQLDKEIGTQGYTFMRAYPTFRLYFIESDLGERKRYGFDDFFAYSSVQELTVIRSRKIAADLLIMTLTNVSGVLTNRKFRESPLNDLARNAKGEVIKKNAKDPSKSDTLQENPIASMMLQPGVQVQLRLGYSNNPDDLEKVFNGVITDVQISGAEDIVEITCQSYGIELVQNVYGEVKKFGSWYNPSAGATPDLLEELLASPEVVHFGRWEGGDPGNMAYGLIQRRWKFRPTPADDNVFAPCKHGLLSIFDDIPKYVAFNTTIWDIFQEMTLRHPGYVASVVPYEEEGMARSTMFFGVPDQLYFARDPTTTEKSVMRGIKDLLTKQEIDVNSMNGPIEVITNPHLDSDEMYNEAFEVEQAQEGKTTPKEEEAKLFMIRNALLNYSKDRGFIKPFRAYHVLTSTNHILQNTVQSSVYNTFNTVTLQYEENKQEDNLNNKTQEMDWNGVQSFTYELDAGMPDEEKREMFAQYHNCVGFDMAKCYSIALLAQSLRDGYQGSITIIGNPKIKPHDICYVFDEYTDMFGPIEVEQVVHQFSKSTGFITEITPDMCIHVNQASTLSTQDAIGLMAEYKLRQMGLQSLPSIISTMYDKGAMTDIDLGPQGHGVVVNTLSAATNLVSGAVGAVAIGAAFFFAPGATIVAGAANMLGSMTGLFGLRKYIARSQTGNALRYSPLVLQSKPMLGGFPARRLDNGFVQTLVNKVAKWSKEARDGTPLYIDHLSYKFNPNNWVNQQGTIKW